MAAIFGAVMAFGVFFGPLLARVVLDRRLQRADAIAADVRAAIRRRLGGDSVISVDVRPSGWWSAGRIRLSAPWGYQDLIERVWPVLALRIPAGYELVVRPAPAALSAAREPSLSRAA